MSEIQRRREELGWSRAELARRAVIHPSTVSQIENGRLRPYPSQLEKLAHALGVSDPKSLAEPQAVRVG